MTVKEQEAPARLDVDLANALTARAGEHFRPMLDAQTEAHQLREQLATEAKRAATIEHNLSVVQERLNDTRVALGEASQALFAEQETTAQLRLELAQCDRPTCVLHAGVQIELGENGMLHFKPDTDMAVTRDRLELVMYERDELRDAIAEFFTDPSIRSAMADEDVEGDALDMSCMLGGG